MSDKKDEKNKKIFLKEAEDIIKRISKNTNIGKKPKVAHIAYELYVYSLVLEALNCLQSCNIYFRNPIKGKFRPKYAPGKVNSTKYSYVEYDYNGELFEVHLDTQYKGKSKIYHEMDISIINSKSRFINAAIECKYTMSVMNFHYTREFIGMLTDFSATRNRKNEYGPKIRVDFIVTSASMPMNKTAHYNSRTFLKSKKRKYNPKNLQYSNFQNKLIPNNKEVVKFRKELINLIT